VRSLTVPVVIFVAAVLTGPASDVSAQASPVAAPCRVDGAYVSVAGAVQSRSLPYFIEVQLTVTNKAPGTVRLDPGRFVLVPDQGVPVRPAATDEVIYALRTPTSPYLGVFGFFTFGSFGVGVGAGPFDLSSRVIDARILKAGDLAPGATIRGSVYFRPAAWPAQFTLMLDGLTTASGAGLPPAELQACRMPFRPGEPPVAYTIPAGARTFGLDARAAAGPMAVHVSNAEFTRQATTLTVMVENAGEAEANLFVAIGEARLVDNTGQAYAVRMLRSDLPDRVAARSQVRGRLVFEPLPIPPAVTSAVLTLPEIRAGSEAYQLKVDLAF
jgi:hypothetical protein